MIVSYPSTGGRTLEADLTLPGDAAPRAIVVLVHGGGWQKGSRTDYAGWAAVLTSAGFAAVCADYELAAPGKPGWPTAAHDVAAAFAYAKAAGYGPVGALATSSGAHLVATTVLAHDTGLRAAVLVNGVYDLVAGHARSAARGGDNPPEIFIGAPPSSAPADYRAASPTALSRHSPFAATTAWTLIYGEHDPVVPPGDQTHPFAAVLRRAGADVVDFGVPESTHYWNTRTPVDEGSNLAIRDLVLARFSAACG